MNKKLTSWLFSSFLLAAPLSLQAQYHSQVWNPDNGTKVIGKPRIVFDGGQKTILLKVRNSISVTATTGLCALQEAYKWAGNLP